jgi:tagatose-1,6-bisphosphate aldolase non-catalytic subunit AgaZ/GatZ
LGWSAAAAAAAAAAKQQQQQQQQQLRYVSHMMQPAPGVPLRLVCKVAAAAAAAAAAKTCHAHDTATTGQDCCRWGYLKVDGSTVS